MIELRRFQGFRHHRSKRLLKVFLVAITLVIIIGQQFSFDPGSVLRAFGRGSMSHSVGVVDMERLEKSHPSYGQLQAIEEQLTICEERWYDSLRLVAQQASLDGFESPFLKEISQNINPGEFGESERMANLWEEAQREREKYREKLSKEMETNSIKEKVELEKELAKQVDNLQRKTGQEILNRQVELAMLTLTQSEAEALVDEILALQAKADEENQRLQDRFNEQLQIQLDAARKVASEKLKSYDQDLISRMTKELEKLQPEPIIPATGGDDRLASNYPEVLWEQQVGNDYWLNTGNADALESQLLKERARLEERIEPLRDRYTEIQREIQGDIEANIAKVAQVAGLTMILDNNQTQTQGIDITNQVLVILQGEA
jgi:hypothetical protein